MNDKLDQVVMRASRDDEFQEALRKHAHAFASPYEVMKAAAAAFKAEHIETQGRRLTAIREVQNWIARDGSREELAQIDIGALTEADIERLFQAAPGTVRVPLRGKVT